MVKTWEQIVFMKVLKIFHILHNKSNSLCSSLYFQNLKKVDVLFEHGKYSYHTKHLLNPVKSVVLKFNLAKSCFTILKFFMFFFLFVICQVRKQNPFDVIIFSSKASCSIFSICVHILCHVLIKMSVLGVLSWAI